jgi:hypothetical protein
MTAVRLDIGEIKAMLLAPNQLDKLVGDLVPDATRKGAYYLARCPWRTDRHEGSFAVFAQGKAMGGFRDWATDEKGDVIDLIAMCCCGGVTTPPSRDERKQALAWAKSWLGLSNQRRETLEKRRDEAKAALVKKEAEDETKRRNNRRRAFDWWLKGKDWRGTPVETYLRQARGIDLDRLENLDDFVKFLPRVRHFYEPYEGPCMMAAFRNGEQFMGGHFTWLMADGQDKAPLKNVKLTLGTPLTGAALRLTKGASGLTLSEAERACVSGPLAVGEGIETALSVAAACPDLRVWAAGSLGLLGSIGDSPAIESFFLLRDNDVGKPKAIAAFETAASKIAGYGKPVTAAEPFYGKDFNDLQKWRRG